MVNRKRIRGYWEFRHFGTQYEPKKPGLYLNNLMEIKDRYFISMKEVVEIRDFLSRYINAMHLKTNQVQFGEMKAKARSLIKDIEKLEAHEDI